MGITKTALRLGVWVVIGLSTSCGNGSTEGGECVSQNPIRNEADVTGDQVFSQCAAVHPEPGATPPKPEPCDASTLAAAERECAADGAPCSGKVVVSRSAALCIAAQGGELETLEGPFAELFYHSTHRVPVWSVNTVTAKDGSGRSSGLGFTVDATTGELLSTHGWSATP